MDYSRVVYADPRAVRAGLNSSYVSDLICSAAAAILAGFPIPVGPDENSSPLGRESEPPRRLSPDWQAGRRAAAALMQEDDRLHRVKATGLNPSTGEHSFECWARAEGFLCDEGWFRRCGLQVEPGWHAAMQSRFALAEYCG